MKQQLTNLGTELMRNLILNFVLTTFCLAASISSAADTTPPSAKLMLPPLDPAVTSFGAAVADDYLYVYGGHLGSAHQYSDKTGSGHLRRIKLSTDAKWEDLAPGPGRTGLAMVAYVGKVYRIGGFEARNPEGKDWELFSTTDFACYDPSTKQWSDLAPLPAGRSSHDAALVGSKLYVFGGWNMQGKDNTTWHKDGLVCDLASEKPQWTSIAATPPFQRRALAVAAWQGKLYIVGGMTENGEMVTAVDIFDPETNAWSKGPSIPGEGMEGFGVSAFASDKSLIVTPHSGAILQLASDGQSWQVTGKLQKARFFHRQVATPSGAMVVVAGSTKSGKTGDIEVVSVP